MANRKDRKETLDTFLPYFKDESALLRRALKEMDKQRSDWGEDTRAFRMFFGLGGEKMHEVEEIAAQYGIMPKVAWQRVERVIARLKHSRWYDPTNWSKKKP